MGSSMSQPAPLWVPQQKEETALYKFVTESKKFHGGDSTVDVHRWSIENPDEFWRELWDFLGVIGERGARAYLPSQLPQSTFFPHAKVVLSRELVGTNERCDSGLRGRFIKSGKSVNAYRANQRYFKGCGALYSCWSQ